MKKAQFLGWFKKAYPDIRCTKSTAFDNVYVINGRKVSYVSIKEDTQSVLFYGDSSDDTPYELDEDIVMKCRNLYGEPRVVFQYSENKSQLKNKKQEIESTPESEEEKKSVGVEKKKETTYNKDIIVDTLKEHFGDKLKLIPKYSKIEVYVDEVSGPILGDQGLSPNNKMRYKFILYSDKTEIKQILENFFNLFN